MGVVSISTIRKAFQRGLGEDHSCLDAQMTYAGAGKGHILRFKIAAEKKGQDWWECVSPKGENPEAAAEQMGKKCAAELDGRKAKK